MTRRMVFVAGCLAGAFLFLLGAALRYAADLELGYDIDVELDEGEPYDPAQYGGA